MRRKLSLLPAAASADPTSLEHLFDIVTPPPAPGWFVVGGIGLALVVWTAWHAWKHWRAEAYRRAALAEWQQLKTRTASPRQREVALQRLPELIKCTAPAAFPRADVASLSGMEWLRFLDRTGHTNAFTQGRGQLLPELAYNPRSCAQLDAATVEELFRVVCRWIDRHSTVLKAAATPD